MVSVIERSTPPPAGAEILSFTATPMQVQAGQPVTLSWSTRGAESATIVPAVGVLRSASGSIVVSPRATTRYTLQVTPDAPPRQIDVEVLPAAPPPVDPNPRPNPNPGPVRTSGRGWDVYHHHGFMVPTLSIDWGQTRNGNIGMRQNNEQCVGTLVLDGTHLRFDSRTSNDGFDTDLSNIDKVEVNRTRIGGHASFQVKIRKGRNFNFVPRQSIDTVVSTIKAAMK